MGVPKRRVSHARQGDRRSHHALTPAAARGVSALPPAEAGSSRVPHLRLVRRPRGRPHQAAHAHRGRFVTGPGPRPSRTGEVGRGHGVTDVWHLTAG